MTNFLIISNKVKKFNKTIRVGGDKSISIRWVLFASLAEGVSKAKNLLMSEDVLAAIKAINKLGIKSKIINNVCKIYGKGINGQLQKSNYKLKLEL